MGKKIADGRCQSGSIPSAPDDPAVFDVPVRRRGLEDPKSPEESSADRYISVDRSDCWLALSIPKQEQAVIPAQHRPHQLLSLPDVPLVVVGSHSRAPRVILQLPLHASHRKGRDQLLTGREKTKASASAVSPLQSKWVGSLIRSHCGAPHPAAPPLLHRPKTHFAINHPASDCENGRTEVARRKA